VKLAAPKLRNLLISSLNAIPPPQPFVHKPAKSSGSVIPFAVLCSLHTSFSICAASQSKLRCSPSYLYYNTEKHSMVTSELVPSKGLWYSTALAGG